MAPYGQPQRQVSALTAGGLSGRLCRKHLFSKSMATPALLGEHFSKTSCSQWRPLLYTFTLTMICYRHGIKV